MSALFVVKYAKDYGPGSGIPEVKTILGGFIMKNVLSFQTGGIKILSLALSVASGLSVGNKAPLVHIAACVGYHLSQVFPIFRNDAASLNYLLSCATAAGIAVGFGRLVRLPLVAKESCNLTLINI
jgi:chloride channel 3/4/5